jgi:hypothetical protein
LSLTRLHTQFPSTANFRRPDLKTDNSNSPRVPSSLLYTCSEIAREEEGRRIIFISESLAARAAGGKIAVVVASEDISERVTGWERKRTALIVNEWNADDEPGVFQR